jgi:hypothetical protein
MPPIPDAYDSERIISMGDSGLLEELVDHGKGR